MKDFFIYGKHPILLAIKNQKRFFKHIYTSNIETLRSFLQEHHITINNNIISYKNNNELARLVGPDVNHQGYVALVGARKIMDFEDFVEKYCDKAKALPKLVILDQLVDPHNIGAIIRSAVAFGVRHIILTRFNTIQDSATIIKTSAGTSELVNIIEVGNLNNALQELKNIGYFIIGMAGEAKQTLKDLNNIQDSSTCLLIGNEGKGIRPLVKKNCDILCRINIDKDVESLNASVACSIALYQLWG